MIIQTNVRAGFINNPPPVGRCSGAAAFVRPGPVTKKA